MNTAATYGEAKYVALEDFDSDYEIVVVHPDDLDLFWVDAAHLLYPALEHSFGKYTLDDIYIRLQAKTAFLWLAYNEGKMVSAGVTWVDLYPQSRTLTLGFAGGDMQGLIDMIPWVKEYAEQLKCDAIECEGRSGWRRVLAEHGFDKVSYTVRMNMETQS